MIVMSETISVAEKLTKRERNILTENQARVASLKAFIDPLPNGVFKNQSKRLMKLKQEYVKNLTRIIRQIEDYNIK